jgi:hypothetical protein
VNVDRTALVPDASTRHTSTSQTDWPCTNPAYHLALEHVGTAHANAQKPGGEHLVVAAAPVLQHSIPFKPLPDGLSPLGAEVIAFIASGVTNAQIANTLIVSPSTV